MIRIPSLLSLLTLTGASLGVAQPLAPVPPPPPAFPATAVVPAAATTRDVEPSGGVYDPDRSGTQVTPGGSLTGGNMTRTGAPERQSEGIGAPLDPARGTTQTGFTWSSPGMSQGAPVAFEGPTPDNRTGNSTNLTGSTAGATRNAADILRTTPRTSRPQPALATNGRPADQTNGASNGQMNGEINGSTTVQPGPTGRLTEAASYTAEEKTVEERPVRKVQKRTRYARTLEK